MAGKKDSLSKVLLPVLIAGLSASAPSAEPTTQPRYVAEYERLLEADKTVERSVPHDISWSADGSSVSFNEVSAEGTYVVKIEVATGRRTRSTRGTTAPESKTDDPRRPRVIGSSYPQSSVVGSTLYEVPSGSGRLLLGKQARNLYVRDADAGTTARLAEGAQFYEWNTAAVVWHESETLVALSRTDNRSVAKIPRVEWLGDTVRSIDEPFPVIGGPFPTEEIHVFNLDRGQSRRMALPDDWYLSILGFQPGSTDILVAGTSRDQQQRRVYACDSASARCRAVFDETTETFFLQAPSTADFIALRKQKGYIALSSRSGVDNLYRIAADGKPSRALTSFESPVSGIVHLDEDRGEVHVIAPASPARPYDQHLWQVPLAGGKPQRLTSEEGQHVIRMAPVGGAFVDYHSSVSRPPSITLRSRDGRSVATIATSAIDAKAFWNDRLPEEFVVKAADGKTDLYGVLYKPYDFDPARKYPVVQFVYGGPQTTITQRHFGPGQLSLRGEFGGAPSLSVLSGYLNTAPAIAQLGFITFTLDARGTPGRTKAFHDAAYRSIGTHEVQDYAAGLEQLLAKRPYMDGKRVGIYGRSFGGFLTVRAMLAAADHYQVGVASAPALGGPLSSIGFEGYYGRGGADPAEYQLMDNSRLAPHLRGKLLLIFATNDVDVPFNQGMQLVESFVRAGKYVDLMVLPQQNHLFLRDSDPSWMNFRDDYRNTAIRNYFACHLLAADTQPRTDLCP